MLKLRVDQVEMFERSMFAAFQAKIERAIAGAFPHIPVDASAAAKTGAGNGDAVDHIAGIVERGIERGVDFDLQQAPDMAAFIALFLSLRLTPTRRPTDWIRRWLERPDASGAARMALIEFELAQSAAGDPALKLALERIANARRHCGDGTA